MNVLVIGSGGREHALVWKLAQSDRVERIYAAPGNPGMAHLATCLSIAVDDLDGLVAAAQEHQIDMTVVGPELPLTLGIVDRFQALGMPCFGPSKAAAELEGSKAFSKHLMKKYHIPTAAYEVFTEVAPAKAFADKLGYPVVIKADGLAAGKGVLICENQEEAYRAVEDMLVGNEFGEAGHRIVIEEFMTGPEVSILAFADGTHAVPMVSAQDHKRIFENDKGPNTGGMGAYSPAPMYDEAMAEHVFQTIIQPTVDAMKAEGRPFTGILYTGLMLTEDGPKVLEYNVRFGDPETQPVLMRLESDLLDVFEKAVAGELADLSLKWKEEAAVCVVLAARNYPGSPVKGDVILGLDDVSAMDDTMVFHAGTALKDGAILTNGGRVLGVTALGQTIAEAIELVYKTTAHIHFEGMQYRRDIGARALKKEDRYV